MQQLLSIDQQIFGQTHGLTFQVAGYIGGGGQGEVYRVFVSTDANQPASQRNILALKWFFPHYLRQDTRLRSRLERAVQIGPPSNRFLWPLELVTTSARHSEAFGYIMPLREGRFRGMVDVVTRRITPSLRALVTASFEIAHSFLQLHAKGLCYRDISFGNIFLDPASGEVRICDNDNVDIDGQPGAIGGTARFMAPEIVRGESLPSTNTDLFSLAVLLFYLLINHHPLEGSQESAIRCFDLPAMTKLYGHDPLFIFDPVNAANRPLPGYHDNALAFWPIYPQFIRDLFTRSFTQGLHDPLHGRVRESEWRAALIRLRDSIFPCTACQAENCYDPTILRANGSTIAAGNCWACQRPLRLPGRLRIHTPAGPMTVMLTTETALYPHHLDDNSPYDFSRPLAKVVPKPATSNNLTLQNLSTIPWTALTASGTHLTVAPGDLLPLATGTRIRFGPREGEIRL